MKKTLLKTILLLFSCLFFGNAWAQQSVTGKVTDETNQPLPGVTVVVTGTTIGVITGADGSFTIAKVQKTDKLRFSFIGMQPQEVTVGNQRMINVKLQAESVSLNEVVAIGYGTQKRRDIIGSYSLVIC